MAKKQGKTRRRGKGATGGETHQRAQPGNPTLTTNQGTPLSDNQNSLRAGVRGPTLLEDFIFREKITHFDHERIPERIVHARGSGAHGYFQPYQSMASLTRAGFLQNPKVRTPVFVRFSTVAGGAGSGDTPRDVRGFAVKFYTQEGNFDLVGNNIPVFFIQDAIKFPDLIHAVKMEPDRGFPQAASAHDTFWDFVSLMPESMHMLMWVMSDRTLPRSLRMMEGFGVHTFRMVTTEGRSTFVKFHWRPMIGAASLIWDESVKLYGADPDSQRRDLHDAIARGDFPEFEFSVQAFDQKTADSLPVRYPGRDQAHSRGDRAASAAGQHGAQPQPGQLLCRNGTGRFPSRPRGSRHRLHATTRCCKGGSSPTPTRSCCALAAPTSTSSLINRPKCPMHNFQRDGVRRMEIPQGRVAYEPNSLAPDGPREDQDARLPFGHRARSGRTRAAAVGHVCRSLQPAPAVLALDVGARTASYRLSLHVRAQQGRHRGHPHAHARASSECRQGSGRTGRRGARHGRTGRRDHAGTPGYRHGALTGTQPRRQSAEDAERP